VIDLEPVIRTDLEWAVPLPPAELADWGDVLERAELHSHGGRRRLVALLAAAVVAVSAFAVVTPLGGAIVQGVGDFSSWLIGQPGEPASPAEQEAFQAANERSWSGFAPDAQLRRLIETEESGTTFTLYGFRSGDELCLRLVAKGEAPGSETHCAPVHALQTATTPALVVAADVGFGLENRLPPPGEYLPTKAQATFGIASDGVSRVVLDADDGVHDALVAGNAFLYVADHPKTGARVRRVEAVATNGSRVALGFESAPFGEFDLAQPPTGKPQGPSRVERHVQGGSIGWIERLEPRGEPIPPELRERVLKMNRRVLTGASPLLMRVIRPDPGEPGAMGIVAVSPTGTMQGPEAVLCVVAFDNGGGIGAGCGPFARLFERGPFTVGLGGSGASQYSKLSGLASDDVQELRVFLASGKTVEVPLRDNMYRTQVARSDFPIRLAAYDGEGRVIGIETFASDGMTNPAPPEARTSVRELLRVAADGGAVGILRAGTPAGGYRCWHADFTGGSGGGGCTPWPYKGPVLGGIWTPRVGDDTFLTGEVEADVARLTVTYPDGEVATITPHDSLVLYAVPNHHLGDGREVIALRGYDTNGDLVAQRGIRLR
jgi:hypothetical protein